MQNGAPKLEYTGEDGGGSGSAGCRMVPLLQYSSQTQAPIRGSHQGVGKSTRGSRQLGSKMNQDCPSSGSPTGNDLDFPTGNKNVLPAGNEKKNSASPWARRPAYAAESPEPDIQPAPIILPCQLPTWEYIEPLLAELVTFTNLKHVKGTVDSVPDNSGTQDTSGTQDISGTHDRSRTQDRSGTTQPSRTPDRSGTQDRSGTPERSGTPNVSETFQNENQKLLKDVSNIFDNIPEVLEKMAVLADDSQGFLNPRSGLVRLLENLTGNEREKLINVLPIIAKLALDINQTKPYLGLEGLSSCGEINLIYPFIKSLLALSFFSIFNKQDLNLCLHNLDVSNPSSLLTLHKYINFFYSERKVCLLKIRSDLNSTDSLQFLLHSSTDLIPVRFEDSDCTDCLHLVELENLKINSGPSSCDILKDALECTLLSHLLDFVEINQSIRLQSISEKRTVELSLLTQPEDQTDRKSIINSYYQALRVLPLRRSTINSVLRQPSVSAVTSPASGSDELPSQESVSLSDSLVHKRETESEKSYSLSEKESEFAKKKNKAEVKPKEKVPKLKKRESFKERLKASLARGNTPDIESDDQSVGLLDRRILHQRRIQRRQRSSGFRVDKVDESDDFFTATDDEMSCFDINANKRKTVPTIPEHGLNDNAPEIRMERSHLLTQNPANPPVVKRKMMKDKSFDFSISSAQMTSPSPGCDSRPTSSSCVYSDSCSISSEDLGIPRLIDDHLEEVCEKLETCIETGEGGVEARRLQVYQTWKTIHRSLSDTQIHLIEDMQSIPYSPLSHLYQTRRFQFIQPIPQTSFSCVNLPETTLIYPSPKPTTPSVLPLCFDIQSVESKDDALNFLILWAVASYCGIPYLSCRSRGNQLILQMISDLQSKKVGEVLRTICETSENDDRGTVLDFLNIFKNKTQV